jgi:hypothetical protein
VFTTGIVGHVTRNAHAESLARRMKAFVCLDSGVLGCDQNHIEVLDRLCSMGSQWSIVLEDDAVAHPGVLAQLEAALPVSPSPVVSLYLGRQRPPQYQDAIAAAVQDADDSGAAWIVGSRLLHGVGYAIKTSLLESLLYYPVNLPIDEHISSWARLHGHVVSYTWPSLVDHADMPTIVAHRDGEPRPPGRVAWRVGQRQHWTSQSVALHL